jgi:hypothetical protein
MLPGQSPFTIHTAAQVKCLKVTGDPTRTVDPMGKPRRTSASSSLGVVVTPATVVLGPLGLSSAKTI